jgi:hypothetical protein
MATQVLVMENLVTGHAVPYTMSEITSSSRIDNRWPASQ